MGSVQIGALVFGLLGALLCIFGYLIRFKGKINLIAGINTQNTDKIKDKKGLALLVGSNILFLGVVFCSGAVALCIKPENKTTVEQVLLLSLLIVLIMIFTKAKKYIA